MADFGKWQADAIKHKAKRVDNGNEVEGYYFKAPLTAETWGCDHFSSGVVRHCIAGDSGVVFEVDPETVRPIEPEQSERMTIGTVDVCKCGLVMHQGNPDDYDTLGADGPICCPDCGNEKFQTVEQVLKSAETSGNALLDIGNFIRRADVSDHVAATIKLTIDGAVFEQPPEKEQAKAFYIQHPMLTKHSDGLMHFWRSTDCGYGPEIEHAKLFTLEEIAAKQSIRSGEKLAWPRDYIAERVVDGKVKAERCERGIASGIAIAAADN